MNSQSKQSKRDKARIAVDDLDVSENNSFSASIYDNLQNSLNNSSLFLEQDGGKVKKTRKAGSKKRRSNSMERPKKGSKKAGSKKSKSKKRSISMEGGKKGSKKASSKKRRSKKRSISMERPKKGSKKSGSKKGSKKSGSKKGSKKGSKRAGSKVKRALPEKLQEFQKLVKHMKSVTGEHSKFLFTLAKQIREEITKSNPNISTSDLTKKAMKYVDDNKSKVVSRYNDLKKK